MRDPCGDGNVLSPDSISVNILGVILSYSFARCHHWEHLKRTWTLSALFLTTACDSISK